MEEDGIQWFSEGCISHIISLTSPADACRLAAVSEIFRSAADSDSVWKRFLPPDFAEIISRVDERLKFSSLKDLFFLLCKPLLLDGARKTFSLEPRSGKKCIVLSARELTILGGDSEANWRWSFVHGSRFSEAVRLHDICRLDIRGKIDCRMLSGNTSYAVRLIFEIGEDSYGLDFPQRGKIKIGAFTFERTVSLCPREPHFPSITEEVRTPRKREDGWMEVEVGRFFCYERDDLEVEFSVTEIRGLHWKRGLLVEGVEVKPESLESKSPESRY